MKTKTTIQNLTFTIQIFREGKMFIAHNPELKVSSCGNSLEEAKLNLRDAISGFLKSVKKLGTLQEILEEAGFVQRRNQWFDPELLVIDRLSLAI